MRDTLARVEAEPDSALLVTRVEMVLDIASRLGLKLDLWQAQNQLLNAYATLAGSGALTQPLRDIFVHLAERLNISPTLLGWRP
jgi:hypothetical protein